MATSCSSCTEPPFSSIKHGATSPACRKPRQKGRDPLTRSIPGSTFSVHVCTLRGCSDKLRENGRNQYVQKAFSLWSCQGLRSSSQRADILRKIFCKPERLLLWGYISWSLLFSRLLFLCGLTWVMLSLPSFDSFWALGVGLKHVERPGRKKQLALGVGLVLLSVRLLVLLCLCCAPFVYGFKTQNLVPLPWYL